MSAFSVGIDLGTTYSAISFLDKNGKPETIRSEEGELTTPSVVFFDSAEPIIGREAIKAAEFDASRVARYAKRCIGDDRFPKSIDGQRLSPEVIQALIVQKLKCDAERKLGCIEKAVITVPAFFNETRRKATNDAAEIAGVEVMEIINEPTAAAIAYGVESGFLNSDGEATNEECVLVYDLGGGTFDATLMKIEGNKFTTLATEGDVYLGGIDWDKRLVDFFAEEFKRKHQVDLRDNPSAMERLIQEAESTKRALTAREQTNVRLGHGGNSLQLTISRKEFEDLTADLLERTRMTCDRLLADAKKNWSDLSRLILVGGSTRMPMVHRMLEKVSSTAVDRSLAPDEAVAHGAAIYAGILSRKKTSGNEWKITNVNSHDLGVLGIDPATKRARRQKMICKNTPIPATLTKKFTTSKHGQKDVLINIVEGGNDSGEHSLKIGQCVVNNLPADLPKGTVVKVTFRYERDGRLSVSGELPDVECSARTTIDRCFGLSKVEVEFWKSNLENGFDLSRQPLAITRSNQANDNQRIDTENSSTDESLELDDFLDELESAQQQVTTLDQAEDQKPKPESENTHGCDHAIIQVKKTKNSDTKNRQTKIMASQEGSVEGVGVDDPALQEFFKGLK